MTELSQLEFELFQARSALLDMVSDIELRDTVQMVARSETLDEFDARLESLYELTESKASERHLAAQQYVLSDETHPHHLHMKELYRQIENRDEYTTVDLVHEMFNGGRRWSCPLCNSVSQSCGYKLPEGLFRHLSGRTNGGKRCIVTSAAQKVFHYRQRNGE